MIQPPNVPYEMEYDVEYSTPCAMSLLRGGDGTHPRVGKFLIGQREVRMCRNCMLELSNRDARIKLEEPNTATAPQILE